jgi:hypothetical protein
LSASLIAYGFAGSIADASTRPDIGLRVTLLLTMRGLTYYCWHCYAKTEQRQGACRRCSRPIEAPAGTSYLEQLVWALDHPLGEVRLFAVQTLGAQRERTASDRLRRLALESPDPYVAAEAVRSLVSIEGLEDARDVLEHVAETGAAPARRAATDALAGR